jgi:hypothetical protein
MYAQRYFIRGMVQFLCAVAQLNRAICLNYLRRFVSLRATLLKQSGQETRAGKAQEVAIQSSENPVVRWLKLQNAVCLGKVLNDCADDSLRIECRGVT